MLPPNFAYEVEINEQYSLYINQILNVHMGVRKIW